MLFDFGLVHLWRRGAVAVSPSELPATPAAAPEAAQDGEGLHCGPANGDSSAADADAEKRELRDLTGECGSLRYMSPEVANNMPYNHLSEVFSWADVLWEMAAHRKPFMGFTEATFKRAVLDGHRPPLKPTWPVELRELLEECWQWDPACRPEFREILPRLEAICAVFPVGGGADGTAAPQKGACCTIQ